MVDEGQVTRFPLGQAATVTVGRAADCDIRVRGASVSRQHVRLHLGEAPEVEDLGSSNGTVVAGERLGSGKRRLLVGGEPIVLGDTMLMLMAEADGGVEPDAPATPDFVVEDPRTRALHRAAEQAARFPVPVLILGETGTGKEVLAEIIHRASPRAAQPFVKVNCAAIAPNLVEAELFGHERGAFTDAGPARPGLLEAGQGGSVFLDEIGELPVALQPKLLRVLETRELTRVGGVNVRKLDVRFISATNQDLDQAVAARSFRQDLLFRINTVTLRTVPLRERTGEIVPLARHFLRTAARELGVPQPRALSPDAERALRDHPWPGNVRELRNVVYRAMVLAPGDRLEASHFVLETSERGPGVRSPPGTAPEPETERERIEAALSTCGGNQRRAAAMLGMSLRTLVRRLSSHELPRPRERAKRVPTKRGAG